MMIGGRMRTGARISSLRIIVWRPYAATPDPLTTTSRMVSANRPGLAAGDKVFCSRKDARNITRAIRGSRGEPHLAARTMVGNRTLSP